MDCIFCKIAAGEIPSEAVYEDDKIYVFKDLNPQAPVHLLAIPRKHIEKISEVKPEDEEIMGHLICKIPDVIDKAGLDDKSIRIVNNCGEEAGQTVFHVHFHILGGRKFGWPPG